MLVRSYVWGREISQLALIFAMMVAMLCSFAVPANAESTGITSTEVSFLGDGDVTLHGTIVAPSSTGKHYPGIVMVGGAGPVKRDEFQEVAEAFAKNGIVTLIYDKRSIGYSMLHRDYSILANDSIAGMQLLRTQKNVDQNQVGIFGLSEGAWVAPLAAIQAPETAFVIAAGAVGVSPARQQAWAYGEFLRHAGVTGSFLKMMQVNGIRQLVDAGLFTQHAYDPVPSWEQVHQPVLALWGALDREAVPEESSHIIQQALERGGNTHYTIAFIEGARHNLNVSFNGGFDRPKELADGFADTVGSWVNDLAQSIPIISVQAAPHQDRKSVAIMSLSWLESGWLQLGALLLFIIAFSSYPFVALYHIVFKRRSAVLAQLPARWLVAVGLTTILGFVIYFLFTVVTAANLIGPVVLGQPIPWLVLRLLAIATIVLTIFTFASWRRKLHQITGGVRIQLFLLALAGVVFIPWAFYWRLLI
ncbi:prolyl oligopeptidase family serine peptidase [Paenibacillus sp. LMG 31458]|uniref:Prolyl oligopeptidase family serine peptidase n=1 Tax=Paenibacillus phytorum TaxID=2654977 RepID=A0ABX1Y6D4_9BACL|nr:alpha/beta hydrolase [Paenibacillus phytorum]NOU75545.1 prolyl oligopeptidase family serine peptidase [Paenibacillus phytorum]